MPYMNTATFSVLIRLPSVISDDLLDERCICMTMEKKKTLTPLMSSTAGAINGLLVGLIAEEARIRYLNYQMDQAAREYARTDWAVDFVDAYRRPLVPLICVLSFAATSYLLHRYLVSRPQALLFSWVLLGGVAVCVGYFMSTANPTFLSYIWIISSALVSYLVYRLWTRHLDSFSLLWLAVGISAVIVVAVGVQLVGLFFYWPELRNPLLWLLCLLGVVATNLVYGIVAQFILDRFFKRRFEQARS